MQIVKMQFETARLLIALVHGRAERARRQGRNELGASAVEWAIISAIVVTLALAIGVVVKNVIDDRSDEIQKGTG